MQTVTMSLLQIIPPAVKNLSIEQIQLIKDTPLELKQPCHNQAVERHVKIVTDAASYVAGFEKRDGLIRQRIASRKLRKKFCTEGQFM